ncbi:NitT/TauT family transport system substrate-binding protein [Halanaerobium saccharolyticum]|uniref:NitT/TauT family transport system substrate-binding protein n=1 Tax=Halanaerobium saccharolyticum TaxID=43595 RepID=A0A4R6SFE2_9FIRM|nr:ABC transporter substrate-binding protein [Halanaerobium saccharolyticum]TDQ00046.1 NitT/TauT family transport system substrate-binding protein [Halanaerobium saccharolyticum]
MKKYLTIIIVLILTLLLVSGCENNEAGRQQKITIAEQYGLAYAPVQLIKELKFLEEANPNLEVEWKQLSNTTSIRESMLAGEVDIAFMAIPPFLIARDKGMEWKIISGLSESPLGLMTNRGDINSLADFKADAKIALPQPGSIQHILLSMAAEREFGEVDRFDEQLLTMSHPDAMNALLAGREVSAHFASPPYLFLESKEEGIKKILSGREAFGGDFTFIIGVSTEEFYEQQPKNYAYFLNALEKAIEFIDGQPEEIAEILADNYNLSQTEMLEYLNWPGMTFTSEIKGLNKFIDFMAAESYLEANNYQYSELVFEKNLAGSENISKEEAVQNEE